MKRFLSSLFSLTVCTCLSTGSLHAQAPTTAKVSLIKDIQVGLTLSSVKTDEVSKRIDGVSAYAIIDFTRHLGIEFDLHDPNVRTPNDFLEKSYLVGVRYVYRYHRLEPYARGMIGIGKTSVDVPNLIVPGTPGSYNIYAIGGGLDLRLSQHLNVRAIDFEQQRWNTFPPNGLTPTLVSAGIAYRFHATRL